VIQLAVEPANLKVAVREALMQVGLHGQWRRAQCASRLRVPGREPPSLDYILWIKKRRDPIRAWLLRSRLASCGLYFWLTGSCRITRYSETGRGHVVIPILER